MTGERRYSPDPSTNAKPCPYCTVNEIGLVEVNDPFTAVIVTVEVPFRCQDPEVAAVSPPPPHLQCHQASANDGSERARRYCGLREAPQGENAANITQSRCPVMDKLAADGAVVLIVRVVSPLP